MTFPTGDWGAQFRWSLTDTACQEALAKHRSAMAALKIVYDNDGLWDWGDPKGDGPELLRRMMDQYADAGAEAVVWGCGNNLAWSYTPGLQEAWCDRVPKENPSLAKTAQRQRDWLDAGTDPLAVLLERANARRLPVLAGFRLNRFMPKFGSESWIEKNPHVVLSEASCPMYANTFSANLALPEVREHFVAHSIDVVERYEVDGLHLEFMRAIPFFEKDEPDKIGHMNTFLKMLRTELDRIGQKRGRRMKLAIWSGTPENYRLIRKEIFPPEFFDLAFHGIDPRTWIAEGTVDLLMMSVWSGLHERRMQPVDMTEWMDAAHESGKTKVLGTIDNAHALHDSAHLQESTEVIRSVDARSDGVYLFNTQPLHLALLLEGAAQQ
ncbi:MAG: family 10 glycosylhydrolase [Candidatus Latescibacteria bacterium]|nr:family 10 glycosylhydrolase [Candidatus Latescibacterota bacterium]